MPHSDPAHSSPDEPRGGPIPRLLNPEERLQLALDAGAITGTWFWDVVHDHFTADRRFSRYFSLDEARLEAGVTLAEVVQAIHPDDEPRVQQLIGAALAQGGPYRAEYRVRQADGHYRWVEANGKVSLDAHGQALTFPGVLVDIHPRKVAEARQATLFRLNDRLRVLDSVEDIIETASAACGTTLDASRAGYGVIDPVEDLVDIVSDWHRKDVDSIVGQYRFHDFGSFINDLRHGRMVVIEDVLTDPRTASHAEAFAPLKIRALLNVPMMRDGQFQGVMLVHDDVPRRWSDEEIAFAASIADRTWAAIATAHAVGRLQSLNTSLEGEVALRSADRNLIWNLTRDLMLVATTSGVMTAVNPAWSAILGWDESELIGHQLFELAHPDDQAPMREGASSLGLAASLTTLRHRFRHKDGSHRWISWSATLGNGVIVAAGRDVSDGRELALAQEQLRQSQKMEAVGQLTGGVAHDFNNLLTVISTSVMLLKSTRTSAEQKTRALDAVARTVQRAARLTGQLLAFARQQALTPTVFDAAQNVTAVLDMLDTLVGARIQVDTLLDTDCFIHADPSQFDTALVNLVVNARDAMEGAGRLSIEVRRAAQIPAMRLSAPVDGDFVAVTVTDSGGGIARENLERIFEPFYTTKAVGQGTGLGLSQVFGFAKQSGGDVGVASEPGQGASFTLYFPRSAGAQALSTPDEVASPAAAGAEAPAMAPHGLILVVEDNAEVAEAVEASLHQLGYRTELCRHANQALERLEADASRFDLVFSDVVMAGMDGMALAREVRQRWPALPVVLSSGYSHVLANDTFAGFELLAKPYELDALAKALERVRSSAGKAQADPAARAGLSRAAVQSMLHETHGETARQEALDKLQVLDSPAEPEFDDLVAQAAAVCGTPIALISLIDRQRQWFKARVGLQAQQTHRDHAFCAKAIQTHESLMVVEDATQDPRFLSNPLVTGDPHIRFYAGAPLIDSGGHALGTLCVISPEVRVLAPQQAQRLRELADEVVRRLEARHSKQLR